MYGKIYVVIIQKVSFVFPKKMICFLNCSLHMKYIYIHRHCSDIYIHFVSLGILFFFFLLFWKHMFLKCCFNYHQLFIYIVTALTYIELVSLGILFFLETGHTLRCPTFANSTYLSERASADRNFCLAYMMREEGAFPLNTDILKTLESYFMYCSIECTFVFLFFFFLNVLFSFHNYFY